MRRKIRRGGRSRVIVHERSQVHADAVPEGDELKDGRQAGKHEERNPKGTKALLMVDVTDATEPVRNPRQSQ